MWLGLTPKASAVCLAVQPLTVRSFCIVQPRTVFGWRGTRCGGSCGRGIAPEDCSLVNNPASVQARSMSHSSPPGKLLLILILALAAIVSAGPTLKPVPPCRW
jgi:hypothetical protein